MNYRHAFHAGNFADVHKHSVLARILVYLRAKPAAFRVLDTHAGLDRYDLFAPEPSRGGEWQAGIGRVWEAARQGTTPPLLAPYLEAVGAFNADGILRTYPGSPLIAQHLLRRQDRLIACELEPRAASALDRALHADARAKAISIDGWTALGAYLPPKERRGLVLVDPPFEDKADFALLSSALAMAHRKWPSGIYLLWYPIKEREGPDALARRLKQAGAPNVLRSELTLRLPRSAPGLIGTGLIVVNPPFTLERDLRSFMPALAEILSPESTVRTDWLNREHAAGSVPVGRKR
jgi:23S rRNA (adenine2030-N6)-methyltransferase